MEFYTWLLRYVCVAGLVFTIALLTLTQGMMVDVPTHTHVVLMQVTICLHSS